MPRRCSSARRSLRRQVVVLAALPQRAPLRARASAPARVCRPACAAASSSVPSSSLQAAAPACTLAATCCAAVSMARCSSPRRAASVRDWNCASCARALERAQLLARVGQLALGGDHRVVELGVALLRRAPAACRVPRSALRRWRGARPALPAARRSRPARRRAGRCARWLPRPAASGAAARPASWCARVCASAASRRTPAQLAATLRCTPLRLRTERAARVFGDQRLRALLAVEVLDLLRARQHAGLLGVRRVEADRELRHRMALAAS